MVIVLIHLQTELVRSLHYFHGRQFLWVLYEITFLVGFHSLVVLFYDILFSDLLLFVLLKFLAFTFHRCVSEEFPHTGKLLRSTLLLMWLVVLPDRKQTKRLKRRIFFLCLKFYVAIIKLPFYHYVFLCLFLLNFLTCQTTSCLELLLMIDNLLIPLFRSFIYHIVIANIGLF